jgi:hypothetical protein
MYVAFGFKVANGSLCWRQKCPKPSSEQTDPVEYRLAGLTLSTVPFADSYLRKTLGSNQNINKQVTP